MKAIFARKMVDIEELKAATARVKFEGYEKSEYIVTKEVKLSNSEFSEFSSNFFEEQNWIGEKEGGKDKNGLIRCIRVINALTNERILVNPEGYSYPRYTAFEE